MVNEASWHTWTVADLHPYVTELLETFGPARLLFGSDWPVCTLAATYSEVLDAARRCLSSLSPAETAAVFGNNAIDVYRL